MATNGGNGHGQSPPPEGFERRQITPELRLIFLAEPLHLGVECRERVETPEGYTRYGRTVFLHSLEQIDALISTLQELRARLP